MLAPRSHKVSPRKTPLIETGMLKLPESLILIGVSSLVVVWQTLVKDTDYGVVGCSFNCIRVCSILR